VTVLGKFLEIFGQILCGHGYNFQWIVSDAKNLHVNLSGKQGVLGGHEDGLGYIHIGRISYQGETKIGRVTAYKIGDAKLSFHDRGAEKWIDYYEVLHFVDNVIHPKK
jgi:hypothetical protein